MNTLVLGARFERAASRIGDSFEAFLRRPGAATGLVVLLWACAVLPNLAARSFIWEEGTNADIARDVLNHGHFLVPYIYGIRWHEKPSLLAWLIAGVAALSGRVDEWSARLPAAVAVLFTALLVQSVTRRYASAQASLFAALCLVFSPLLLQKVAIAEPDTVITALSFGAWVVWWNGAAAGRVTVLRWAACGLLLTALAMAKGPQPAGFFVLGIAAYLLIERRWRDFPGLIMASAMPIAAIVAWGAAIYQPGDEGKWVAYARLVAPVGAAEYIGHNFHSALSTLVELLPATLFLPFVLWSWWRQQETTSPPPTIARPLLCYSAACMAALVLWPGFNSRYAMPIAPSIAVLVGLGWDALEKPKYALLRRSAATLLGLLIVYQLILVIVITPLFADRFGQSRIDAETIEQTIDAARAPAYCLSLDTNQLFYISVPLRCLDANEQKTVMPPAWLIIPRASVAAFAALRPDLDVRVVRQTESGRELTATRIERK